MSKSVLDKFMLKSRIIVITGGAGLLGLMHARAIMQAGGTPVLLDINEALLEEKVCNLKKEVKGDVLGLVCDITDKASIESCLISILKKYNKVDGLVNNAANDPKVSYSLADKHLTRFENITLEFWEKDIKIGLTGAFLCSQVFGTHMASSGGGVILNIASDLSVIAPDQRIYRLPDVEPEFQPVKPVTYSAVKAGLVGLSRYLATYWAEQNVRVNSISPGGVFNHQNEEFVSKVSNLIPMGRMADVDEYMASLVFMLSEASSYMTGTNVVIDGGRSAW